jgi:hypothetical protein
LHALALLVAAHAAVAAGGAFIVATLGLGLRLRHGAWWLKAALRGLGRHLGRHLRLHLGLRLLRPLEAAKSRLLTLAA